MTADELAVWDGSTVPASADRQAAADLRALALDPRAVDALDVVRVLVALDGAPLPPSGAAWFTEGRRFLVALVDRYGYAAGLRAFPDAEQSPGFVFADRGGLAAIRAPGGQRVALTIAEGLPRFLRAALRPSVTPRTLGVVTSSDWTSDLAARIASRAARINVVGSAALAAAVRATCGSVRVEAEGDA